MRNYRQILFGEMAGANSNSFRGVGESEPDSEPVFLGNQTTFDGPEVLPVFGRPDCQVRRSVWIDHTVEVILGDVPESLSADPFERTLLEYNGVIEDL